MLHKTKHRSQLYYLSISVNNFTEVPKFKFRNSIYLTASHIKFVLWWLMLFITVMLMNEHCISASESIERAARRRQVTSMMDSDERLIIWSESAQLLLTVTQLPPFAIFFMFLKLFFSAKTVHLMDTFLFWQPASLYFRQIVDYALLIVCLSVCLSVCPFVCQQELWKPRTDFDGQKCVNQ